MFVRSRERPSEMLSRFLFEREGFEVEQRSDLFAARVVANADRAVEIFDALAGHLEPLVRLFLQDVQSHDNWTFPGVSRDATRAAISSAARVLTRYGGAECTMIDGVSQVSLGPHLEVYVYSRSTRWYYLLRGMGLSRHEALEPRSWRLSTAEFPPVPARRDALLLVARSVGLDD